VVVVLFMGVEDHQEGEANLSKEVVDLQVKADPMWEWTLKWQRTSKGWWRQANFQFEET
jgi:hypothetical protein